VKITPVNPTCHAVQNGLSTHIDPYRPETGQAVAQSLTAVGYDVIVSIGEVEENAIGSNCGQYVLKYLEGQQTVADGYKYQVEAIS
jgi:23S rRNA (adenine2503-C2)-methyltransferase